MTKLERQIDYLVDIYAPVEATGFLKLLNRCLEEARRDQRKLCGDAYMDTHPRMSSKETHKAILDAGLAWREGSTPISDRYEDEYSPPKGIVICKVCSTPFECEDECLHPENDLKSPERKSPLVSIFKLRDDFLKQQNLDAKISKSITEDLEE